MNTRELQQVIAKDLKQLKALEMEIIPANIYYIGLLRLLWSTFWKMGSVLFIAIIYVYQSAPPPNAYTFALPRSIEANTHDAFLGATLMALAPSLILLPALSQYFLIKYHLQYQLQMGNLLVKKLKTCAWFYWSVFVCLSILFTRNADTQSIFFMLGMAMTLSAVVTYVAMGMEFNRAGLSVLLTAIKAWFQKDNLSSH